MNEIDPFIWLNDALEKMVSGELRSYHLGRFLAWNWKAARQVATAPPADLEAAA